MDKKALGKLGEKIAVSYLKNLGYKVVEKNFYKRAGEIDIVALDKETLVFVEVKTRMIYDTVSPEDSMTPWKIRTVGKTCLFYKKLHPELPESLRIDFIGIVLNEELKVERLNYIKNIT